MNILLKQLFQTAKLRALIAIGVGAMASVSFAQTVTGSMTPAAAGPSTATSLALTYAGFTSNSTGFNLRVYYNSTAVTPGTPVYTSPPGNSQPANPATAGTLAGCAGADNYIRMNWVDFGGTWPTPTNGSLGTVPFTTTAGFAANTSICFVEDLGPGGPQRNVSGNAPLNFVAAPVPTAPTASPLVGTTLTGGTGSVPVNVATAGIAAASLGLTCTIPAGTAAFAVASGGTRSIAAPAALGANAPAIGLTCKPQAAAQTATLSCAQVATPGPNPAALTATITCPAIVVVIPVVTATTSPGALALPSYSVSSTPTSSSAALFFNTTGGASSLTCVAGGAGYSVAPVPLALTVGTSSAVTVTYTGASVGTFVGTLTCTPTGPATGGPFVYQLSTTVQAAQVIGPTVQVPTIGALGLGSMSLLIAGFAGFQQRRRVK